MADLVVCDMDGTLLDDNKRPSPLLAQTIEKLRERGIRFVIASGRQYANILETVSPVVPDAIISENGALGRERGLIFFAQTLSEEAISLPLKTLRAISGISLVFAGINSAYVEDDNPEFLENLARYYRQVRLVSNAQEAIAAAKDELCKIACFDPYGAETNSYALCRKFSDRLEVSLSGEKWMDLSAPGTNKGVPLEKLQEKWNIPPERTIVIGDYPNDIGMMKRAAVRVAMGNAHPRLAAICNAQAPSNREDGVVRFLTVQFNL